MSWHFCNIYLQINKLMDILRIHWNFIVYLQFNLIKTSRLYVHISINIWKKCDTLSNDTSSNEPFRLKVTVSKWHFVRCAHCRKTGSSNSFDENISWLISNKPVAMLLCWSCTHHMTTDNDYGQCRRWYKTLIINLSFPFFAFYNILEFNIHPFLIETFTTHKTQQ